MASTGPSPSLAEFHEALTRFEATREKDHQEWLEMRAKNERSLAELQENLAKTERLVDHVTRNVGGLNNCVGEIVEMVIIPGLKEKMNAFDKHFFTMASPRKRYDKLDGSIITEVDLLLENCTEVMVVEVKTSLGLKMVKKHLARLELLRENESITGMTGKTMYAAVAAISFDDDARELAVKNGMYTIEVEDESDRIKVIPPPGNVGTW